MTTDHAFYSPTELRALVRDTHIEVVEIRPRSGVNKDGEPFPMGHELFARFEGADLVVHVDPAATGGSRVYWGFPRDDVPIMVRAHRRHWTDERMFDGVFDVESDPDEARHRIFDPQFGAKLTLQVACVLDDVIAIRRGGEGRPGFGTFFRVAARPETVAKSFELTCEIRQRIFSAR